MSNRKWILATLVLVFSLLLAGCLGPKMQQNCGEFAITLDLPDEVRAQYVEHELLLTTYQVTVSKDGTQLSETFTSAGKIFFRDLPEGTWDIEVLVQDADGFVVLTGSGSGVVMASTHTSVTIAMNWVKGQLDVTVIPAYPADSAKVYLIDPTCQGYELIQTITPLSEQGGTVSFADLHPTTWPVRVETWANGVVNSSGTGFVDLLPGRTTQAVISTTDLSQLEITLTWQYPPAPPQNVSVTRLETGEALVNWALNTEDNIAGYLIYRSESETGRKRLLTKLVSPDTTYTDQMAEAGTAYWYWVQAYNLMGFSSNLSEPGLLDVPPDYRVVFMTWSTNNTIYDVGVDGSDLTVLEERAGYNFYPDISPDGTKVVYTREEGLTYSLVVKNLDGTGLIEFTLPTDCKFLKNPKWSPDGTKIAFAGSLNRIYNIYTVNSDLTGLFRVTNYTYGGHGGCYPLWSPDGSKILYRKLDYDDYGELYVISPSGENNTLVASNNDIYAADWSPTGEEIVYMGHTDSTMSYETMCAIKPDGTGKRTLYTSQVYGMDECRWSPDGSAIAFIQLDTTYNYFSVKVLELTVPGATPTHLHTSYGMKAPCWTPDSQMVLFASKETDRWDIYRIPRNEDDEQMLQLTNIAYYYPMSDLVAY